MSIKLVNLTLLIVFVVLIATIFLVRRSYDTRNIEILPGMVAHVAYAPQSSNMNFPDKKTLQPPPAGTIAIGFQPLPYNASPEDAIRAGNELHSPLSLADSLSTVERGAKVFAAVCSPCHGPGGAGDGLIAQRGFPPPPSLFAENAMKMKEGQMFHIMTFGQKSMPSFASQVTRADRWRVSAYIRFLQKQHLESKLAKK